MPHLFGPGFSGAKPSELVQLDYVELGPSRTGERYVLTVRHDHRGYS